ncbi:MAG: indolepyruvate ferredoxin oxidoreductase [Muribaculaceae bacterium]|nr:indolepyruvate ferredoxin oxidoreductase [Muribaculaceae bacterium]
MTQKQKRLLLGDEAFALGAINAGLSGAYAYPGTPSTEVLEFVQLNDIATRRNIHCKWSSNEKTAMEEALGMSFCGKRAIVSMKHVGMNVAADPFVNSAMTGANGGLLVVAADDPSMHSSQNEQDSRFYADFAMLPVLEPSDQQEAYDMAKYGFQLSESMSLPVLIRFVTRLSHSRAIINVDETADNENELHYPSKPEQWVLMPALSRKRYKVLIKDFDKLKDISEKSPFNFYQKGENKSLGIIASGVAWNYLKESYPQGIPYPVVKVSQYPLPENLISQLIKECETILILEEGQPFIEKKIRGDLDLSNKEIYGKLSGEVERTGELTPDLVKEALYKILGDEGGITPEKPRDLSDKITARPPALCKGCGHRDVFQALNEVLEEYKSPKVFGDIGCYTLGYLAPFNAIDTVVDMGASITMAKGAADAGQHPAVAVIGDSTFTHSGMTGLLDAVNENSPMTVIITDNLTTGMTGGQDSQGTGKLEEICLGIGVHPDHLITVASHPNNLEEMKNMFKKEIDYPGLSVVISRRECIQTARRKAKTNS